MGHCSLDEAFANLACTIYMSKLLEYKMLIPPLRWHVDTFILPI